MSDLSPACAAKRTFVITSEFRGRLVVYVTDMYRFRPFVNKEEKLWGAGPHPPRTIIEVHRLNGDDICEVEGTFYAPSRK